jgi:hypothetical protein
LTHAEHAPTFGFPSFSCGFDSRRPLQAFAALS